jgi:DNA-directed RNA polymerase
LNLLSGVVVANFKSLSKFLDSITTEDLANLGGSLLTLMLDNDKMFEREYVSKDEHLKIYLKTKLTFLNKLIISSLNITQLPMLVKPRMISSDNKYSPYLNPEIYHIYNPLDTVIKPKYDQREVSESSSVINSCVDYLNSIPFTINKEVLDLVITEWEKEDSNLFKGVNREQIINETDSKEEKREKVSHNSKYFSLNSTLMLASLYRDHEFYLPVFCDFRGRLYTHNTLLTYQGHDLSRALLLFSKNELINNNGKEALLIYFANLAGFDKLSWSERIPSGVMYFKEHYPIFKTDIESFYKKISTMSEPFQLLSIFKAMERIFINQDKWISNPILFDASCNGIQHLSAMTKEIDLAIHVNLISQSSNPKLDTPADFYIYALNKVREALQKSEIKVLNKIILSRKMIKRSVMTIPYNISLNGIGEHLKEHFLSFKDADGKFIGYLVPEIATLDKESLVLSSSEFGELTKIVFNVLTKEMPSLKNLGNYLESLVTILAEFNLPVIWITPAGMIIKLSTVKMQEIETKINLIDKGRHKVTISLPTKKLNIRKIKTSLMPNLIHSLDACNIHLLVNELLEGERRLPLYTIHDCFASTPNNISTLEIYIKRTFLKIYFEGDYLEEMHKNILAQITSYIKEDIIEKDGKKYFKIKDKFIPVPEIPDTFLDKSKNKIFIQGLLNSKYFIG